MFENATTSQIVEDHFGFHAPKNLSRQLLDAHHLFTPLARDIIQNHDLDSFKKIWTHNHAFNQGLRFYLFNEMASAGFEEGIKHAFSKQYITNSSQGLSASHLDVSVRCLLQTPLFLEHPNVLDLVENEELHPSVVKIALAIARDTHDCATMHKALVLLEQIYKDPKEVENWLSSQSLLNRDFGPQGNQWLCDLLMKNQSPRLVLRYRTLPFQTVYEHQSMLVSSGNHPSGLFQKEENNILSFLLRSEKFKDAFQWFELAVQYYLQSPKSSEFGHTPRAMASMMLFEVEKKVPNALKKPQLIKWVEKVSLLCPPTHGSDDIFSDTFLLSLFRRVKDGNWSSDDFKKWYQASPWMSRQKLIVTRFTSQDHEFIQEQHMDWLKMDILKNTSISTPLVNQWRDRWACELSVQENLEQKAEVGLKPARKM